MTDDDCAVRIDGLSVAYRDVPVLRNVTLSVPAGAAMGVVGFFTLLRIPLTVASFMLMIRRLHDVGLSGYFCLAAFIPFVNLGLILYLLFKQGTVGDNAYGPDPLGSAVGTAAPDTPQRPENPYARATYGDAPTDIAPPHDQKD